MAKLFKNIESLFKKKEFWFTVITYPLVVIIYLYVNNQFIMYPLKDSTVKFYSTASFWILFVLVVYSAYELVEKRLLHKRQGDRLKMKQGQKDWRKQ